ncbi:MAG: hypothetical protein HY682_02805 [Chloroflexi bacterium]|nr:hypothetical protein [Chloroflexota bacterium]
MDRVDQDQARRGLRLLLLGAAAHEVECEGHVAVQERRPDTAQGRTVSTMTVTDLERLFRGA